MSPTMRYIRQGLASALAAGDERAFDDWLSALAEMLWLGALETVTTPCMN